ncbi:restriction endonuclease subunit S [Pseudoalteromonas arctica]|jgi:type I restriction enzyme S subunit|uniref:Type I restriction enzyme, S subunit n=1 Tax=Pseudoalteromonas arctica A 37-1-2 TaxID=1117313 RepID=A0A290SAC6_9GAMM|nr:restriction endonuclease subunit S [Pseudoalteromonas arctica]ATC89074.1 type I restriction enzyme, S subunit [Pseudoalteromonas arctica A 37-1-2]
MIPALRFSKFKSEYLPKIIDEIAKVTSGGTPSRAKADYWNGHIPWVTTSQINFKDITAADEYITDLGLKKSSAKLFPKGTILLALYGQGITRGRVSVLEIEATTNQACAAIILESEDVNTRFTFYYLQSKYEDIRNLANDGGQKNLSGGLVKSLSVVLPSDVMEQAEVADFLTSVDNKISQLIEKHCLLKDYKKGVMQQIFSQQIRFKDDDGNTFPEWNTHELAMLSESGISNGVFNDPKKVGKGFRLINVKDMYKGDSIEYSELTLLDLEPKLFEKNKVKYGDIFFTRSSIVPTGIAFSNVNLSEKEDITFDGHLMKISPNKKLVDPLFLAYYLRSYAPRKALVSRGKQSTMTTIAQDDIKDIKLNIPALKEQQKIAQFLQSLDKKINAVNEQIEQTKLFKKGLLQQMFV